MSTLSTHVLDTALGRPAPGIRIVLERDGATLGSGVTDADGRVRDLAGGTPLAEGSYRLTFHVGDYFAAAKRASFYSRIAVDFRIGTASEHYHVPLLLSPYGYATYRGS
ncbi:MAG TPA: hydroxyisourate hydrolase [Gemmatimonadaceae bacterium]|jgi:5-hydroxyisourate hydrolase|nr:hydroxyisourate hydrolase [Gemmatimonadaceae bacterium]